MARCVAAASELAIRTEPSSSMSIETFVSSMIFLICFPPGPDDRTNLVRIDLDPGDARGIRDISVLGAWHHLKNPIEDVLAGVVGLLQSLSHDLPR